MKIQKLSNGSLLLLDSSNEVIQELEPSWLLKADGGDKTTIGFFEPFSGINAESIFSLNSSKLTKLVDDAGVETDPPVGRSLIMKELVTNFFHKVSTGGSTDARFTLEMEDYLISVLNTQN